MGLFKLAVLARSLACTLSPSLSFPLVWVGSKCGVAGLRVVGKPRPLSVSISPANSYWHV